MLQTNTILQNRYRIVRLLKVGGMGEVYEAVDERLNSQIALKRLAIPNPTPILLQAFEREATLLGNLKHPALPRVSDHFNEQQSQFLVMEFVPGLDLAEILQARGKPFDVDDVIRWADQLLDVLDYLHSQNPPVFHRDIKPQNLKITARGQIILLDFGLAKGSAGLQLPTASAYSVFGYTPGYAPLEQMQGVGTGERSDLYALGATLYHLLTNTAPPDALTRAAAQIQGQSDPLHAAHSINPAVPLALSTALMDALALNFNNRPASAAVMRQSISNPASPIRPPSSAGQPTILAAAPAAPQPTIHIAAPQTIVATPVRPSIASPPTVPVKSSTARRWVWVIGLVAIALIMSGIGAWSNPKTNSSLTQTTPPPIIAHEATPTVTPVIDDSNTVISKQYAQEPAMVIDPTKQYTATIKMQKGTIVIQLNPKNAPRTVNNFVFLARDGFYDGVTFHRVIGGFIAQGGDPTGTGTGGPGYEFVNENDPNLGLAYDRKGILAMANAGPDTNGSQFFITLGPTPNLTADAYTIFGQVIGGMDVVKALTPRDPSGDPSQPPGDKILTIEISEGGGR